MKICRTVDSPAKFDRNVVVRVGDSIDAKGRGGGRNPEDFGGPSARPDGVYMFLDSDYVDAAHVLVDGVKVFLAFFDRSRRESVEKARRNHDVHQRNRAAFELEKAFNAKERCPVARAQLQKPGTGVVGRNLRERQESAFGRDLGSIVPEYMAK